MSALRCGVFAAMVLVSGTALAAEPLCSHPLAKIKAEAPKGAKFEKLTPGQFHLAQGIFIGTPPVTAEKPPGDGAVLMTVKGGELAVLFFTKGDKMCAPFPMPLAFADLVMGTKTAHDEKAEKDIGEELHL